MRISTFAVLGAFTMGVTMPAMTDAAVASVPAAVIAQLVASSAGVANTDQPDAAEQRMRRRFPQSVRVGDLIGLPVLDDSSRTLGYVRAVVRTRQNKIELIVDYDGWFGWDARPVAVPIELIGIQGRQLVSLDMSRAEYDAAPTWQYSVETAIADSDSVSVALARR
jgi:PRC-barrel domain